MENLTHFDEEMTSQGGKAEIRALTSKIKGVNSYLASLLQKKLRIELEIRRTRTRLSKLKSRSQTIVRTKINLEGQCSVNEYLEMLFSESFNEETDPSWEDYQRFKEAVDETDSLLQEVQILEEKGQFST